MKKYVGTKEVKAQPMSRGSYNSYRGWTIPENENPNDEGYLVEYLDGGKPNDERHKGYISWSPKDVFEKSYKVAETHVDRIKIEMEELVNKCCKLNSFFNQDTFENLDEEQKCLMKAQSNLMQKYYNVLYMRVNGCEAINSWFDFGVAIDFLKAGFCVRRRGWNGKGMFVVKQVPAHITEEIIPKMQSLPQSVKDIIMNRENKCIDYANQMLLIQPSGRADSWIPSSSDVFATDWEIAFN